MLAFIVLKGSVPFAFLLLLVLRFSRQSTSRSHFPCMHSSNVVSVVMGLMAMVMMMDDMVTMMAGLKAINDLKRLCKLHKNA